MFSLKVSQFSGSVLSNSLRPHESQHTRPPCPSPTPGIHPNSYPLSQWCHPAISSSVIPFSSCPLSLPASGSFPMSQLFEWGGHKYWSFNFSISLKARKDQIMPFAATWTQLEIMILSEVSHKDKHYLIKMWNWKYDSNEPIWETDTIM